MHNSFKRFFLVLTFVSIGLAPILASETSMASGTGGSKAPTAVEQAEFAVSLFMQSCLSKGGDQKLLRSWANDEAKLPRMSGEAAESFLRSTPSKKGMVWAVGAPQGKYVLVSDDSGMCGVYAEKADADSIHAQMKWLVDNLKKTTGEEKITYETKVETSPNKQDKATRVAVRRPERDNDIGIVATTFKTKPNLAAAINMFAIPSGTQL